LPGKRPSTRRRIRPSGYSPAGSPALLKTEGYVTAQFGKNQLGDHEHLPTNRGFDEWR
jgi:arylsulfatase A-like enzyme